MKKELQCTEDKDKDELQRVRDWNAVLCTTELSDPEYGDDRPPPILGLKGEAERAIAEMARQIHCCCSDKKWTSYQKRVACEQLVKIAVQSTNSIFEMAMEFPEPIREIAEELRYFPWPFPARAEELEIWQKLLWDHFNLGKRHTLKLRASPGRKTFSTKTWINRFVLQLIGSVHEEAEYEDKIDPDEHATHYRDLVRHVPLTPENAKRWLDAIWELLLRRIPNPEAHPRLRQFGNFPSRRKKGMNSLGTVGEKTQASNIRASIKAKLGLYLKRMLNDQAVRK